MLSVISTYLLIHTCKKQSPKQRVCVFLKQAMHERDKHA